MFDFHHDSSDQDAALERLRQEVMCLSMNLEPLAGSRPQQAHFAKACFRADDSIDDLLTDFSYEPVELQA